MNLELVQKASEQFEKVNKITPKYLGEIVLLDPYSKLTAEWGSMAMSYWRNNQVDSAVWAFTEGKERGGFGNFVLEINRKVLDACSQNSILVSCGDNFTIPLWYLQIVEGYRKDVGVIDIGLLNTRWYPAYLLQNNIVNFDLPSTVLDSIEYIEWADSTITIDNFSWTVRPSMDGKYLLRGDRILLSILKQNKFVRDIFFTIAFMEDSRLSLKDYLTHLTIVDKFTTTKRKHQTFEQYKKAVKEPLMLSSMININSPDELGFYDCFRYDLLGKVNEYLKNSEKKRANELMNLLDKYGNERRIPYTEPSGKNYVDYLRRRITEN
jgi:hypothetical protein